MEVHVRYGPQTAGDIAARRQEAATLLAAVTAQGFREVRRKDKLAKDGPVEDDTGLPPLLKAVDAIWRRS
jgi:hypothetical protein